MLLIKIHFLVT